MTRKRVYLIGAGVGSPDYLTQAGAKAIEESPVLLGAKRILEPYEGEKKCISLIKSEEIYAQIQETEAQSVAVLFSGDLGFYSGAKKLLNLLQANQDMEIQSIPGLSSVQYFCSQLQTPWEDCFLLSAHGRSHNALGEIQCHPKTFLLMGDNFTPKDLISALIMGDLGQVRVSVGEYLSYPEEKITTATAKDLADMDFASLSVVLVENPHPIAYRSSHLPDSAFSRGKVPMTKEEIRIIALSKLAVRPHHVLWDVGAGTGSVSVEMAFSAPSGQVFAVEEKPEALDLLAIQKETFSLPHLRIIPGTAPQALADLPSPDGVFIGGSRGNLEEILSLALEKNPQVKLVITAITLETLSQATTLLEKLPLVEVDIVQIAATRTKKVGKYHMMDGLNPVWILSAKGELG